MALSYALMLAAVVLALWGGSKLLHRPSGSAAVMVPAHMTSGAAPGPVDSGGYRLTLDGVRWVRQDALPPSLKLEYRARPNVLVDYLVLDVTVANTSAQALALRYAGTAQDVRFELTSVDPEPFHTEPVAAAEAPLIAGTTALAGGPLAAGARRSGVLVFALEPFRKRLALLLVPHYPAGTLPDQGPPYPAIRLELKPGR